jgi:hypothetical protein
MSKKKRFKKIFESASIESADVDKNLAESVPADAQSEVNSPDPNPEEEVIETPTEQEEAVSENSLVPEEATTEITELVPSEVQNEAAPSDESPQEVMETSMDSEESSNEEDSLNSEQGEEESTDDLLDDVRRSLIEAEGDKNQKESKWWRRIGRKSKKVEQETPQTPLEIDLPPLPVAMEPVQEQQQESKPEEEVDQIDMLKAENEPGTVALATIPEVEVPAEPEPDVDFEELKKQAFRPRAEGEEPEPLTDVRSIALEGGEEVLVEVDRKAPDPWEERLSALENALKPYRLYINIALATLGVVMAVIAALIIFRVYQGSRPQPAAPVSNLPYPANVSLPGGWSFKLGKGTLQNGKWEPQGPEWLQGTEVCRWVSLPWSRQLEAVVRTLNPKDPIDLVMSNNDKFVYQVYSVQQLTPEELQNLDSNSPCLLLILTQPDAEKRWVLTAIP